MRDRMYELDSLRGLAALSVLLYHYTTRYDELFGHNKSYFDFKYGSFGVNLFFILSGFVIYMSLNNISNVKDFIIKRAIRLYPAYIFSVILTFEAVRLFGLHGREVSYTDAIINLTMFQELIPGVKHVDGVYWTLMIEMTFYILIGFLIGFGLVKKIEVMSIMWLGFSTALNFTNDVLESRLLHLLQNLTISSYSHLFVAGIMFYLIKTKCKKLHYFILSICIIYEYVFRDISSNIFITLFFVVFICLVNGKLRFLRIKPLIFLGNISYSLYLIHQNIGYIIINYMENQGLNNPVFLLIPISVSIAIATVITFYIELPIQKYLKFKNSNSSILKIRRKKIA